MGKSKKNRAKDKRSSGAYYDDYDSKTRKNKRSKNRNTHQSDFDYPRQFTDWDSL